MTDFFVGSGGEVGGFWLVACSLMRLDTEISRNSMGEQTICIILVLHVLQAELFLKRSLSEGYTSMQRL